MSTGRRPAGPTASEIDPRTVKGLDMGRVTIDQDGGLRTITLSRPDKRNGMDTPLLEALVEQVRLAVWDRDVRAVLLIGDPEGRAFSAGGDPAELAGDDPLAVEDRWTHIAADVAGRIFHAEKPVIAAVDGPAVGAGCALALACDVVLASPRARFAPVFTQRGILPDHALLWFLPRQIGLLAAKELVLTGRTVDADEALRLGLCTRVLDDDDFAAAARRYARELAEGPTRALGAAKVIMNKGLESDMWSVQVFERLVQPGLFASEDFREGFTAFAERRPPRFRGR